MKEDKPSLMPLIVVAILMASLIFASSAEAQNLGDGVLDKFVARTSGWWPKLRDYALYIFKMTATLEIVLFGIRMVLQKSQLHEIVGQFVMTLLFICFIAAVIMNYKEWASAIAITGLDDVVTNLSAGTPAFDAGKPVAMIFACLDAMVPVLKDASVWDFGMVMIYVFCMASITAVFVVICCRYIIVVCEFHIVANAGILLIGLGGSKVFKEYAINVMKYVLSIAVKLFIFQLICTIGFSILSLTTDINGLFGQSISNIKLGTLMEIVVQGALLLGVAWTLPQVCAGLISGASIDGGNPLRMMGGAVVSKGMSMVANAGKSAAQTTGNMRTASKIASASGVGGGLRNLRSRASHMRQSMKAADMGANPNSIKSQLGSQLNMARAARDASKTGETSKSKPN